MNYNQIEKEQSRIQSLSYAVKVLTDKDQNACLIDKKYVKKVRQQILKRKRKDDKEIAHELTQDTINNWERFYSSIVKTKKPSQLRVAYFSGPNPENDLRVFTSLGILPENVWAFESDNKTYDSAIINSLNSEFPHIKIYKGDIKQFFEFSPIKFDIVYLDFCGTITSKSTLPIITSLFNKQVLNSPSVLLTNFAYVEKELDEDKWISTMKLCTKYLWSKEFTEDWEGLGGGYCENPNAHDLTIDDFLKIVCENPINFYGQFITRVLMDMGSVIVPYQRFVQNRAMLNQMFSSFDKIKFPEEWFLDWAVTPEEFPLIWALSEFYPFSDCFEETENGITPIKITDKSDKMHESFVGSLAIDSNADKLFKVIEKLSYLDRGDECEQFYSQKLKNIEKNWIPLSKYIFCDVFLFHQIKDILLRQICVPYHYNTKLIKRWTYKAKERRMFLDAIVFDECRYIYDFMPTIDMIEASVDDIDRQLAFRFALDGISKHNRWYNYDFLSGTAVTGSNETGFECHELSAREKIN